MNKFKEKRLNPGREFLAEHPEVIISFIKNNKKSFKKEKETGKSGKFEQVGIKVGEKIHFYYQDSKFKNIEAEILEGGKIKYKGKIGSLSSFALQILKKEFNKKWSTVQGTIFWSYKGKTIRDIFNENDL